MSILMIRAAALALLLTACDANREEAGPGTRAASGAAIVRNAAGGTWTTAERWRLVPDGTFADPPSEPLMFPGVLEPGPAGTLYALDLGTQRVHVYDAQGRHVRAFGRAGGGPGEFKQPVGMALAPDESLWVVDAGNLRYTVFDPVGVVRATHRRDGMHLRPWPGRFDRQGRLWDVETGPGGLGAAPVLVRRPMNAEPTERFELPAFSPARWSFKKGPVENMVNVPYSPELVWALNPDGRIWSGISSEYRLVLHEPGGDTLRVSELPLPPVPVTAAERERAAKELKYFTDQGGRIDLSQIPRHKPAFTSIHVDDQGYLWIRPALPEGANGSAFDVLDPEGKYLGRVTVPVQLDYRMPVAVRGDRLYTVVLSKDDVPQLVRFRIEGRTSAETRVAARR
ncbi:MAG TPA: hypothetical protein VF006_09445 [Longimicrobium sp.]